MEILKNNWKIKVISLIVAIFLWSYVIGLENPTMTKQFREIEVVVQRDELLNEEGYTIVDRTPKTIDIEISGKRNSLNDTNASDIYAYVELGDITEGPVSREIKFQIPTNVQVVNASSENVNFQIEKNISKDINVSIDYKNELPGDYVLESASSSLNKISVLGVRSQVDKISKLQALVDLKDIDADQMINVNLKPIDKDGNEVSNVTLGQSFVNVALNISKTKEVPIEVKTVNEEDENVKINSIKVDPVNVIIKGSDEDIEKIDKVFTKEVDLSAIKNGKSKVQLDLPEGISLFNPDMNLNLVVDLEEKIVKEIDYTNSKIGFKNLEDDYNAKISNPNDKIKIKIEGFEKDVESLTENDIKVNVDLDGLDSGTYTLKPKVEDNDKFKYISSQPDSIKVNVEKK